MNEDQIIRLRPNPVDVGNAKHLQSSGTLHRSKMTPESDPGQFVRAVNELADQWAAWRNFSTKKPVHRHLKVVGNSDHRENPASVAAGFNSSHGPTT